MYLRGRNNKSKMYFLQWVAMKGRVQAGTQDARTCGVCAGGPPRGAHGHTDTAETHLPVGVRGGLRRGAWKGAPAPLDLFCGARHAVVGPI